MTHRRRASHCFEECLVFRRERKLTVTVETVAPATRPHKRPGHTPWKNHAARIGPEPFLRLRIQLVPQVLNRWLSHCFPSKQSVHGSGAGVAEASSSPQSMDFGARHRTRPVTYSSACPARCSISSSPRAKGYRPPLASAIPCPFGSLPSFQSAHWPSKGLPLPQPWNRNQCRVSGESQRAATAQNGLREQVSKGRLWLSRRLSGSATRTNTLSQGGDGCPESIAECRRYFCGAICLPERTTNDQKH